MRFFTTSSLAPHYHSLTQALRLLGHSQPHCKHAASPKGQLQSTAAKFLPQQRLHGRLVSTTSGLICTRIWMIQCRSQPQAYPHSAEYSITPNPESFACETCRSLMSPAIVSQLKNYIFRNPSRVQQITWGSASPPVFDMKEF